MTNTVSAKGIILGIMAIFTAFLLVMPVSGATVGIQSTVSPIFSLDLVPTTISLPLTQIGPNVNETGITYTLKSNSGYQLKMKDGTTTAPAGCPSWIAGRLYLFNGVDQVMNFKLANPLEVGTTSGTYYAMGASDVVIKSGTSGVDLTENIKFRQNLAYSDIPTTGSQKYIGSVIISGNAI